MDDLVHHCLRELSFDGDLGELSISSCDGDTCAVPEKRLEAACSGLGFEPQA
jgi:hypothetical protein